MTDSGSFFKTSIQDQLEGTTHSRRYQGAAPSARAIHRVKKPQRGAALWCRAGDKWPRPHRRIPKRTHQNGAQSDTKLSLSLGQRIGIPSVRFRTIPVNVTDMLKANDLKRQQEEEQKLIEETVKETLSSTKSIESLFDPNFGDGAVKIPTLKTSEPLLISCSIELSYILQPIMRQGKCSDFAKVLSARIRPVTAPYYRESVKNSIAKF